MFLEEAAAKALLAASGVRVPAGARAATPGEAEAAARAVGRPVVVKAQVPAGRRGKSGGIRFAETAPAAGEAARALLGSRVSGFTVAALLVEERVDVARELYAAVVTDPARRAPVLLFSTEGGIDIEETVATRPDAVIQHVLDIRRPLDPVSAERALRPARLAAAGPAVARLAATLYDVYRANDAELVEVNPLALGRLGDLVALDAKVVVDDAALARHPELPASPPAGTDLERRGREAGLLFVELDGDVGVLANGAGLTMATMDAVAHFGGRPANFLEIGGQNYKRATEALGLVLANPRVKSLLVNLCGAYARTDVIIEGFLAGWEALRPDLPVAFSIHGTGEARAVELVRTRLQAEPYDQMDDAVKAAIDAARAPSGPRR